jgi:hypothetical protein
MATANKAIKSFIAQTLGQGDQIILKKSPKFFEK